MLRSRRTEIYYVHRRLGRPHQESLASGGIDVPRKTTSADAAPRQYFSFVPFGRNMICPQACKDVVTSYSSLAEVGPGTEDTARQIAITPDRSDDVNDAGWQTKHLPQYVRFALIYRACHLCRNALILALELSAHQSMNLTGGAICSSIRTRRCGNRIC